MCALTVNSIIHHLELFPHPEGGYFKETYRSKDRIPSQYLNKQFKGDRAFCTAIYFLLGNGQFSAFHRIESDETWHHYEGGTLLIHVIHLNGRLETVKLGKSVLNGEHYQFTVPARSWFASEPAPDADFVLTGCTVSPGFDFADFELAKSASLIHMYPQYEAIIKRLTRF